jgi:hypothetical protein
LSIRTVLPGKIPTVFPDSSREDLLPEATLRHSRQIVIHWPRGLRWFPLPERCDRHLSHKQINEVAVPPSVMGCNSDLGDDRWSLRSVLDLVTRFGILGAPVVRAVTETTKTPIRLGNSLCALQDQTCSPLSPHVSSLPHQHICTCKVTIHDSTLPCRGCAVGLRT